VISNFPDFTQDIPYNGTFNPHITMDGGGDEEKSKSWKWPYD